MKRKTVLVLLLVAAVGWLSYLSGCSLLGVSVEDRVAQFVSDLNDSDRSNMYLNFRPGINDYIGIQDPAYWDSLLDYLDAPYSETGLASGDPSNVTFTLNDSSPGARAVRFVMEKVGFDWMIIEMYMNPVPPATLLIVD